MLVSNLHDRGSIRSHLLLRSPRRLWACANNPLLHKDSVRLADLASEPFLMLTVDEAERSAMRYWQKTPHVPNVIFRTLSVEAVRSMVATGMGITILSDMVYRPWSLEGHRIDLKTLDDEVHTMDVGLAWKSNARLSRPPALFASSSRWLIPDRLQFSSIEDPPLVDNIKASQTTSRRSFLLT
jgi:DNA-binding transcriptional LysR family regulator